MRPDDLAAEVIKHLMKQVPNLNPARVDDLIVGNAIPEAEQGMQMARYISLLSLPKNVPGFIINRYCGSGGGDRPVGRPSRAFRSENRAVAADLDLHVRR